MTYREPDAVKAARPFGGAAAGNSLGDKPDTTPAADAYWSNTHCTTSTN